MKLTIKVRMLNKNLPIPEVIRKGEWIDLRASEDVAFEGPRSNYHKVSLNDKFIPLGVAMKLPKGFEGAVIPRSSIFKNHKIILANSFGLIDNSYCGSDDEWKFHAIALDDTKVAKGDRICQFRIQLSQKANFWQKLKWFFCSGIKFKRVKFLEISNRGGYGSTGKN